MEGDEGLVKRALGITTPVERNCEHRRSDLRRTPDAPGRPICFAYQPARISPKLPVGTQNPPLRRPAPSLPAQAVRSSKSNRQSAAQGAPS